MKYQITAPNTIVFTVSTVNKTSDVSIIKIEIANSHKTIFSISFCQLYHGKLSHRCNGGTGTPTCTDCAIQSGIKQNETVLWLQTEQFSNDNITKHRYLRICDVCHAYQTVKDWAEASSRITDVRLGNMLLVVHMQSHITSPTNSTHQHSLLRQWSRSKLHQFRHAYLAVQ